MLVGAGTVTTVEMAQSAVEAGARYIISPGLNPKVVRWCQQHDVPVLPGVATPTDVEAAMDLGLATLKFFPAEQNGGIPMLKALGAPYRNVKFIPTGGVGPKNLVDYLDLPNVVACGGSWMAPTELIDAGEFDQITAICAQSVKLMHGFKLLHVGVNNPDQAEAKKVADTLCGLFGLEQTETPGAYFAGTAVEVMKSPFLGEHGHIAFSTNDVERAVAYFERRGVEFTEEGMSRDAKGIVAIYFKQPVGGFYLHLRRKP